MRRLPETAGWASFPLPSPPDREEREGQQSTHTTPARHTKLTLTRFKAGRPVERKSRGRTIWAPPRNAAPRWYSTPPPKAWIVAAGATTDRFAAVGGPFEPRGHAARNETIAHAEQTGLVIAQILVGRGVAAEPLERSGLRSINFHPSGRSKYVKFSRHIIKRSRLQNFISSPDANPKMAEIQGFSTRIGAMRKHTHAKRVNLTQDVGTPRMTAPIWMQRRIRFGKSGQIPTAKTPKVTKSSRFGHPLVTHVTGNLRRSSNLTRQLNCDQICPVMGLK